MLQILHQKASGKEETLHQVSPDKSHNRTTGESHGFCVKTAITFMTTETFLVPFIKSSV